MAHDAGYLPRAGEIFLEEGLIAREDVDQVLSIQAENQAVLTRNRSRLFGMVLCDLNLVTPMDNYCTLEKHGKLMSVGDYLVKKNVVSRDRLALLTAKAGEKGLPFISFLLEEGVLTKTLLAQILFELFSIPFKSVSDIVFDRKSREVLAGIIPKASAGAQQCIPLKLTGNTLIVGITDPVNLVFLKTLDQEWPRYRFSPVFIPFSGFTWFYRMLYREDWSDASGQGVDLSLLMAYAIRVSDPKADRPLILSLFDRYEEVRQAAGPRDLSQADREQRKALFLDFIGWHCRRILDRTGRPMVKLSLKSDEGRLLVMARPLDKEVVEWQR